MEDIAYVENITDEEKSFWINPPKDLTKKLTDPEINEKYDRGEGRIVVENNREKLPLFAQQLSDRRYIDLRPFYQRRPRWDQERQSRLIESFLINLPVPPVFLYEKEFNSYEVMDGQQRITAIKDFFDNSLELKGLQYWPELDGRTYKTLPSVVKAGIDRRSISSIVMLKESAPDDDDATRLREIVFERLNTGGVKLEAQEIRNALFHGKFNEMLLRLSRHKAIRNAWGLPEYHEDEVNPSNEALMKSKFFSEMEDAEIVLRFFALRNAKHYTRGMRGFLDLYMAKASKISEDTLQEMERTFESSIKTASAIYGDILFRPFDPKTEEWSSRPYKAFCDSILIAVANNMGIEDVLVRRREDVIEKTKDLFRLNEDGTFTGRKNSKSDIMNRISLATNMLREVAQS